MSSPPPPPFVDAASRKAFSSTSSSRRSSGSGSNTELFEASTMRNGNGARIDGMPADTGAGDGAACEAAGTAAACGLAKPSEMPVTDFYSNATVLITGGTGFVGKVLTEKLLRAFGLRKIYMLIRSKDSMSVQERLQGFLNESVSQ